MGVCTSNNAAADNSDYVTKLHVDPVFNAKLIKVLNIARCEPLKFAKLLESHLNNFTTDIHYASVKKEDKQNPGGKPVHMRTTEGKKAVVEAIKFCQSRAKDYPPLPPLRFSKFLAAASLDHCCDIGPKGLRGHEVSMHGFFVLTRALQCINALYACTLCAHLVAD